MTVLCDKKLIKLSNGSYISWSLKRKKFSFSNKNELKLNCAIIEYYEEREKCDEKVISDYRKIVAERNKELDKLKGKLEDLTSEYYELENLKNNEIAELKKRNAEFDCQKNRNKSCYSCANATERCFRNEIGCPCQKYKSYKEEIAELKAYNEKLLDGDIEKHNKIVELQNCNGELARQKASLERWLGEAKELLREIIDTPVFTQMGGELYENEGYAELVEETEQFLKEIK